MSSIFLTEGERTLEIKYNPQITGYKHIVSEQIIQTLGSKYPFIRRNSVVNFRQFTIQGLLSIQSEETKDGVYKGRFLKEKSDDYPNGLAGQSIAMDIQSSISHEKVFRDEVIAFLMDGQPKTFSSTTEGNFQCYLTNISFTPNTQLGRRIYTLSAQVNEIGE